MCWNKEDIAEPSEIICRRPRAQNTTLTSKSRDVLLNSSRDCSVFFACFKFVGLRSCSWFGHVMDVKVTRFGFKFRRLAGVCDGNHPRLNWVKLPSDRGRGVFSLWVLVTSEWQVCSQQTPSGLLHDYISPSGALHAVIWETVITSMPEWFEAIEVYCTEIASLARDDQTVGKKARWEFKYSGGVTGMSKHSSKGRKLLNCHFLNCILHYRLPFKHKVDVVSWQTRTFAFARYYNDLHLDDKRLNHYFLKVSQSEASRLGRKLRDIFGFSLGKLTMVWL